MKAGTVSFPVPDTDVNDTSTDLACSLLADGTLALRADVWTESQVRHWLPYLPADVTPLESPATIQVTLQKALHGTPSVQSDLVLGPVEASLFASGRGVALHARNQVLSGTIDLVRLDAAIHVAPVAARPQPRNAAVFSALTLSAAFLLNRMRRALLHAAAVVAPDGRAWLMVGDAFAGKTTTTVTLIRAGWDYLSDDHVIIARDTDANIIVEGWPRIFHLDRGYDDGVSLGERDAVHPAALGPGRWRRTAPLAGVLFPRIAADQDTRTAPASGADALARLIRQSPWLLADREPARDVLQLLSDTVAAGSSDLLLGRDSYRNPERLLAALRPVTGTA